MKRSMNILNRHRFPWALYFILATSAACKPAFGLESAELKERAAHLRTEAKASSTAMESRVTPKKRLNSIVKLHA